MQTKYCSACNRGSEFSDSVPKFCQHCGNPFAGTVLAQIKPVQVIRPIKRVVAKEIEQEYEEVIPDEEYEARAHHKLPKVELEFVKPQRQRETLRGLALDESEKMNFQRPREKAIKNKKKFEESWSNDFKKGNKGESSIELGGAI
jgi:hypothetical protein